MFLLTIAIVVRLVFSSDYGIAVHVQRRSPQSATTASDLCQMAVDKGTCSRDLIRYYYDPTVDECKRFSYSGCGGNANRFMRRTNCRSRCVKGTTHKPVPLGEPITRKSEVLTNHIESKVRRTLRTTTSTAAPTTINVRTMKSVRRTDVTKATANIRNCPHCDPLFGICVDGECGCITGFRKLGKICIDINECDDKTTCPANSRCVNTMGSFRCDCDAGFTTDGKCAARREACEDRFDVRYTEEDCSGGDQELRFYFDHETGFCRQFFYGGCLGKSRNIFADAYTCESLCANGRKSILLDSTTPQMVAGVSTKMLDSSDADNDHISVTPALDGGGSQLTGAIQDYSPPEFSTSFESQDSEKCSKPFDGVLRLECIDASWVERFYWDDSKKNCEAFWYDSSCDPRDVVGKNFFGSMESCKDHCSASRPATKPAIKPTTKSTTIASPNEQLAPKVQTKAEHSESDPFNLLSRARKTEAETTTLSSIEVPRVKPRQEVSNFEAKTPILPFDRKKYMEEFRKKLTALPSGYKKNTSSSTLSTIGPLSEHFEEQTTSSDGGFALTAPSPTKSTIGIFATSTFDKKKFAEEFRRKLMALPDGTTKKSIFDLPKTFEFRKTPFTLPPSIFSNASTTAVPVVASSREHTDMVRIEPEDLRTSLSGHPDVSESHSHTTTTPTTTAEDFVVETKKSIVETLEYISRPKDLCDEPLQPKLEEDCSNENWELKWFFNKEKGACKSFWYGGCEVEARNFFGDIKSCRKTCGHKYALPEEAFKPHYILTPSSMNLLAPTFSPAPLTSTHLEDVNLFPTRSELTLATAATTPTSAASETTTNFVRNVDAAPRTAPVQTTEEIKVLRSTTSVKTSPHQDVCNQGYDLKWDEDCDNDNWIIRAYFDPDKNGCKRIWWGGCVTKNKNLYSTMAECQRACSHKMDTEPPHYGPQNSLPEATSSPLATTSSHILNDAPEVSDPVFQADLALQLASVKRKHEGRADLAYSSLVNHPVTVSSECLEQFDTNLTASCNDGTEWKNRYFYDADLRVCRMYWNGGCFSTSKNDFPDQESCQWKCMGAHSADAAKACLDFFDQTYKEDCRHGEFTTRYFFNHNLKKCETFYWGGCKSSSQNFFSSLGQCEQLCESPPRELTQACLEPFDDGYRKSCSSDGRFKQYYYFDLGTSTCRMFWFGNCRGTSQNIFPSLESCQWICDRHREERIPASCSDAFDDKYKESCRGGQWKEKVYFDHGTGKCTQFWWDGCTSTSQNIFSNMKTCQAHCENPGYEIAEKLPDPETKFRCLQPINAGTCQETYPFFYFDRNSKGCRPFSYSGCGGNDNRFLTLSQCQGLCEPFMHLTDTEMDCYEPLDQGSIENGRGCAENAGFRFYFDRDHGKCSRFWYLGCGGNANNFYSYEVCQRSCRSQMRLLQRRPRANSNACFRPPGDKGNCPGNSNYTVQRWTYSAQLRCVQFTYSGCGGSENRFATQMDCEETCKGRRPSANAAICSYDPDWGSCNQLRYMWFYNHTRGTCDQFLYGGCDGNPNRFETFELCQKTCELSGLDPCMEPLDRGNWCEAMSNRYYFNKRSRQCKGFHYTGCGKSGNNFLTKEECHEKCEKRYPRSVELPAAAKGKGRKKPSRLQSGYSGQKPPEKASMLRHVVLDGVNRTYYKTEPEWADYGLCLGYRYNVTGRDTILHVHFCAQSENPDCISESYKSTNGEEFCNVQRPFLRGTHLYTWYFDMDIKDPPYILSNPASGRIQRDNETIAAILILKPNHCGDIC